MPQVLEGEQDLTIIKQKNARRPPPGVFFGEELVRRVKRGWRTSEPDTGAGYQRVPRQGPILRAKRHEALARSALAR